MSTTYAHFIGIGGAGMSGIAKVLHERGRAVTGSDMRQSRYSAALSAAGVPVAIGHDAANLGDPEIVVVSTAIPESNPELVEARRRGLPVWPRARMLAELAGDRLTLAVAGTHGKTSTSSMAAVALAAAGQDPTYLIGGELTGPGTNAASGEGRLYVVEADESDGSFLLLDPYCAIVTNVEADHLDHYASLAEIVETFEAFLAHLRPDGIAVLCVDDPILREMAPNTDRRTVTYGTSEDADVRLVSYVWERGAGRMEIELPGGARVACSLGTPGHHMALNATGVLAAAWALDIDVQRAADGIAAFAGVKRRFEAVGEVGGVRVVDDYGHHPTEVKATLEAAQTATDGAVWVVFQPHRYTRTAALAREFGEAFGNADRVVLLDVYSAGEAPVPGVSGKTVVDSVLRAHPRTPLAYFPHRGAVAGYVASRVRPGDLVLTMGAGDITTMGPEIVRALTDREEAGDARVSILKARIRLSEALTGEVRADERMAKHTSYRIGGPADIFAVLETLHDLREAMEILADEEVPWTIVGKGSDLLVSDAGYRGAVLILGREFKRHSMEDGLLRAGAASVLAHLVQEAFSRGLSGLEWAVGIPGTLGGALAMNAGTRDGWIGQVVDTATLFVPGQGLVLVHGRDVVWDYRRSGLAGKGLILEASLKVEQGEPARIRASMERSLKDRKTTQPIGQPSAGSVFVNPAGDSAGRLIEAAGLKGVRHGGARISPVHANFIVNEGAATARDVLDLVATVRRAVLETSGIELQPEIRFLGDFEEA